MNRPRTLTAGLVVCVLLGVADIAGLAGLGADDGPPVGVSIVTAGLGVATLVGARLAWRGRRGGLATVVVSRLLSALLGLPVFFVDDVPSWAPPTVGIFIAITVLALGLLASAPRQAQAPRAVKHPGA